MLADPPQLIGERVRFIVVVKDKNGETERARARVWNDGNIGWCRNLSKDTSRAMAAGYIIKLIDAVENGDMEAIPKMMEAEGH
jgi:hypothetical protein